MNVENITNWRDPTEKEKFYINELENTERIDKKPLKRNKTKLFFQGLAAVVFFYLLFGKISIFIFLIIGYIVYQNYDQIKNYFKRILNKQNYKTEYFNCLINDDYKVLDVTIEKDGINDLEGNLLEINYQDDDKIYTSTSIKKYILNPPLDGQNDSYHRTILVKMNINMPNNKFTINKKIDKEFYTLEYYKYFILKAPFDKI